MKPTLTTIDKRIAGLHLSAQRKAKQAVKDALMCGALLLQRKDTIEHGEWGEFLIRVDLDSETARRYMICAQRKAEMGGVECKSLMDLYRAFGLLPELAGGGNRNGKAEPRAQGQLLFNFNLFGGFMRVIEATKENPFLNADKAELTEARERTVVALKLMDEALEG